MTRVLVTGAAGYVGGRLVEWLLGEGIEVRAVVRHAGDVVAQSADLVPVVLDLAAAGSGQVLEAACTGVSAVIHLAGASEVTAASEPDRAVGETIAASRLVAQSAAAAGVPRVVYLSTVHVYGSRADEAIMLTEDLRPEPRSAYAVARLASEHLLHGALPGGRLAVLRMTNAVGAPATPEVDRWTLVTNDLCRQAVTTGELVLLTPGLQTRDFVALSDVCHILLQACDPSQLPPGTYNLGSGVPTTIRDLAAVVQSEVETATGTRPGLRAPSPTGDQPPPTQVDVTRLGDAGLAAWTPLRDAVAETVDFCLRHRSALQASGRRSQ